LAIFCGVDIVEIDRIKQSLVNTGTAFRDRVFTLPEIEYCERRKAARFQSYAARFAAKEAVSKAFGTGIGQGIMWRDIEILNDENGKPYVVLSGRAKEKYEELDALGISLSMSHCQLYAVAYAVLEVKGK
jgi:holo-[acyl-carrier protein] synthase